MLSLELWLWPDYFSSPPFLLYSFIPQQNKMQLHGEIPQKHLILQAGESLKPSPLSTEDRELVLNLKKKTQRNL